jgi:hypothetical protein
VREHTHEQHASGKERGRSKRERDRSGNLARLSMSVRTITRNVTFRRAFSLQGVDGMQPPGTYAVETDEEQILGLSFLAYRRMTTTITLPVPNGGLVARQVSTIDPADLESALARDLQAEVARSSSS